MKQIEIKISADGSKIESTAEGFKGKSCVAFQEPLKLLGGGVKEKKTKDFYVNEKQSVKA